MLDDDFNAMMLDLETQAAGGQSADGVEGLYDESAYVDDAGVFEDVDPPPPSAGPAPMSVAPEPQIPDFIDDSVATEMSDEEYIRHAARVNAEQAAATVDSKMSRLGSLMQQAERESDPRYMAQLNAERNRAMYSDPNLARALDEKVPVGNPNYGAVVAYTGAGQELLNQEGYYHRATMDSQLQEAAISAEAEWAIAKEMQQAQIEQRAIEIAASNREEEQLQRIRDAMDEADAVAEDYVRRNQIDPSKAWKKRGLGIKIIAALGAALTGDTSHITRVIDEEVDAQKANASIRATLVNRANARISEEDAVFQRVLQRTGSMREAGEVFALGRLKAIAQQAQAMLAAQGVTTLGNQQGVMLAKLHQEINDRTLRLQKMQNANAPFRYVPKIPKGSFAREMLEARAMQGIRDQHAYDSDAIDALTTEKKMRLAAAQAAAEHQAKMAAGNTPADVRVTHGVTNRFLDKTKESRARLRMIDEFKQEFGVDIPSVSWANRLTSAAGTSLPRFMIGEDGRVARSLLKRVALSRLREETGAAYSPQEYDDVAENYFLAMDEEDIWHELQAQTSLDRALVREEVRAAQVTPEGNAALAKFLGTDPGSMGVDLTGIMDDKVVRPRSDTLMGMLGALRNKYGVRKPVEALPSEE